MKYTFTQDFDKPNEYLWVIPNIRNLHTRWINDEHSWASLDFRARTGRVRYGPDFGHLSIPITENDTFAGCRIWIDGKPFYIHKIIPDGLGYGQMILNGNPSMGYISQVYPFEHTDEGLQYVFSDDSDYDHNIHGDWCEYDAWGMASTTLGDYIVRTENYHINFFTTLVGDYDCSARVVQVEDLDRLEVGLEIMFHQTQHADDITMAGAYSFNYIDEIYYDTNEIKLRYPLGEYFKTVRYNILDSTVCQVVTVPHYKSLTINPGCSITVKPWDGKSGGIIVFRAYLFFENYGLVDGFAKGFRGGRDKRKEWWNSPYATTTPSRAYRVEPCGGEGLAGIDDNYGIPTNLFNSGAQNFMDNEPESHWNNRHASGYNNAFPKDKNPGDWPIYDGGSWSPLMFDSIQNRNQRIEFGGGSYNVQVCDYITTRHFRGCGPGSGGGSYEAGSRSQGAAYRWKCGASGSCPDWYQISANGGYKIEYDRALRLNFGCGGASGYTWHMGAYPCFSPCQYPRIYFQHGIGGNGGGLILINTRVCNNWGDLNADGDSGSLNVYRYSNMCSKRANNPYASSAGGGGGGTICVLSRYLNNHGNWSLVGGRGYTLPTGVQCCCNMFNCNNYYYEYFSGKGGDGHFAYCANEMDSPLTTINSAVLDKITKLFDFRLNGYFGLDYRLLWERKNPVWNSKFGYQDPQLLFRIDNYTLDWDDRNSYFSLDKWIHYGLMVNNRHKLFDDTNNEWFYVQPFDIKNTNQDTINHLLLDARNYMSYTGINKYTKSFGAYFSLKSDHQLYSPLIKHINWNLVRFSWAIWDNVKQWDIYTVPMHIFDNILDQPVP